MTRIDFKVVEQAINDFSEARWSKVDCSSFGHVQATAGRRFDWAAIDHLGNKAGNYAFMLPATRCEVERSLSLHGPGGRQIEFSFSSRSHPTVNGLMVLYVGKTSNLSNRMRQHIRGENFTTANQFRKGLCNAGFAQGPDVTDYILKHAVLEWRVLDGDENLANRDLVELTLCARFAPPFNIKSER